MTNFICCFDTREEADLAIEHLVQEHGFDRADIAVAAAQAENSAGTEASGGDSASPGHEARDDGAHHGQIRLLVKVDAARSEVLRRAFDDRCWAQESRHGG